MSLLLAPSSLILIGDSNLCSWSCKLGLNSVEEFYHLNVAGIRLDVAVSLVLLELWQVAAFGQRADSLCVSKQASI